MNDKYLELFLKYGLYFGRILGSKSFYTKANLNHLIIFNARIYLKTVYDKYKDTAIRDFFKGKKIEIWYGDIDFNKDIFKLYLIQCEIKEPITNHNLKGNREGQGNMNTILLVGDKVIEKKIKKSLEPLYIIKKYKNN